MLKFSIAVAVVLMGAVIVYGSLQAQEEFSGGDTAMATSTPVAILQPTATQPATPDEPGVTATPTVVPLPGTIPGDGLTLQALLGTTTAPVLLVAQGIDIESVLAANMDRLLLPGSSFTVQVRGGDNPSRYLYQGNSVATFAGGEMVLQFIAGTHDPSLAATNELHLYGDTGPHVFEIEDADGNVIVSVPVGRGATVRAAVVFPQVGPYSLYDRLRPDLGAIGEYFARSLW